MADKPTVDQRANAQKSSNEKVRQLSSNEHNLELRNVSTYSTSEYVIAIYLRKSIFEEGNCLENHNEDCTAAQSLTVATNN